MPVIDRFGRPIEPGCIVSYDPKPGMQIGTVVECSAIAIMVPGFERPQFKMKIITEQVVFVDAENSMVPLAICVYPKQDEALAKNGSGIKIVEH